MALIRPFRGVRYNPAVVGDLQQVISPPYDVISSAHQTLLHLRSPYNAVRLDLNQDPERYITAARTFQEWFDQKALIQEQEPALYYYTQTFTLKNGTTRTRAGVLAALRLEEFASGNIRPHERTFEHAKNDRLALLRACQAHLSPIFFLYNRPDWSLTQICTPALTSPPLIAVEDEQQTVHQMWRITNPQVIEQVASGVASQPLIIADGHHRYETSLRYRNERAASEPGNIDAAFHYTLAYLTNAHDEGLVILPTHRMLQSITLPKPRDLRTVLQRDFRVTIFALNQKEAFLNALHAPGLERRLGCVLAGAEHYWMLAFDERVTSTLPGSAPLRALDVTVLHDIVLQRFLGLPPDTQKQKLSYTIDEEEALRLVAERQRQAAFLLNPTTFEQVARVCEQRETMPQKSTYFFPKLLTGLVFYRLDG